MNRRYICGTFPNQDGPESDRPDQSAASGVSGAFADSDRLNPLDRLDRLKIRQCDSTLESVVRVAGRTDEIIVEENGIRRVLDDAEKAAVQRCRLEIRQRKERDRDECNRIASEEFKKNQALKPRRFGFLFINM